MEWPVTYRRKVRYSDTDAQGIVFNANYLRYFDDVVTDFFDAVGYPPDDFTATGHDIVLAHAEVDFVSSARIGDVIVTGTRVESVGTTSMRFRLETWKEGSSDTVVKGLLIQVVVDAATLTKKPVPDFFVEAIERLQGNEVRPRQASGEP